MEDLIVIGGDISLLSIEDGDADLLLKCDGTEGVVMQYDSHPLYNGSYEITPSTETQTISIGNQIASRDITVNPIPSNYGLITWNGSVLTVS